MRIQITSILRKLEHFSNVDNFLIFFENPGVKYNVKDDSVNKICKKKKMLEMWKLEFLSVCFYELLQ